MSYYFLRDNKLFIKIYVQPGAKKNEIVGLFGEELKIKLQSPPIEGKANEALLKYLSQQLELPRSQITLKTGQTSRHKVVEIKHSPTQLDALLKKIN